MLVYEIWQCIRIYTASVLISCLFYLCDSTVFLFQKIDYLFSFPPTGGLQNKGQSPLTKIFINSKNDSLRDGHTLILSELLQVLLTENIIDYKWNFLAWQQNAVF